MTKSKSRLTLIGLFVLFGAPIVMAWVLVVNKDSWQLGARTNHGTLVSPARLLGDASFSSDAWTLVFISPEPCDATCREALYKMRQARLALGKDMDRVERLYAIASAGGRDKADELVKEYPGLRVESVDENWTERFSVDGVHPVGADRIFLIDPQGYLVMYYYANADAKGLLKDLKRLLKISKIG